MFEANFPYVVEPMRSEDVPRVMAIEREAFPLPWPERAYHYELTENPNSHYVVLRRAAPSNPEGRWRSFKALWGRQDRLPVLGYGGFWMIAGEAHVSTIAVSKEWRGHGLGELLLWSMLQRARDLGAFEATLEVRISNSVAQRLYEKYGFETVGRRRRYYQDNGEDAWIMTVKDFDKQAYQHRLTQLAEALRRRLRRQVLQ